MRVKDRILALDIGASGLKMAEFSALKSGGVQLVNYAHGALDIDQQADADRSAYIVITLREMMAERNIRPGPVLLSVSGQSVFSRFVRLPMVEGGKLHQIIRYEAQQNVPFPIEEVVWDYQLIGHASGELDVMLAAIKTDLVGELTDCVQSAGLEPDLVDVAPMALYNTVRYNYPMPEGCLLVVDMGARSTDLIFMEEGRIFIRSIPVAGNAITQQIMREFEQSFADAEQMKRAHAFVAYGGAYEAPSSEVADKVSKSVRSVMTRMHAEINRSINFYRSQQGGSKPSAVLLSGGSSIIRHTDSFLQSKLQVDVDYLNPFRNVPVASSVDAEEIGRVAHLFGEVVGLGLRRVMSCPIEISLLPEKVLAEKRLRRKEPYFLAAAAALVLGTLAWGGYYFKMGRLTSVRLQQVTERVNALESVEARLSSSERALREFSEKTERLMDLAVRRTEWIEVLDQLTAALPEGLWITSLAPVAAPRGEGGEAPFDRAAARASAVAEAIEVAGLGWLDKAAEGRSLFEFRDRLRASPLFREETRITLQPQPGPDDVVREFKIRVVLEDKLAI